MLNPRHQLVAHIDQEKTLTMKSADPRLAVKVSMPKLQKRYLIMDRRALEVRQTRVTQRKKL